MYISSKEQRIAMFNKFIKELQEDYISTFPNYKELDYQRTIALLCDRLNLYPKDVHKLIEMAIMKGDLEEKKTISLGETIREKLGEQIEKNKPDIEKEIKEVGL